MTFAAVFRTRTAFVWVTVLGMLSNFVYDGLAVRGNEIVDMHLQEVSRAFDSKLLQERIARTAQENRDLRESLLRGFIVDFVLVASLFGIFLWSEAIQKKVDRSLTDSLRSLRSAYLALEEQSLKRTIESRSIVHDLKNPLGAIRGFAYLLNNVNADTKSIVAFSERIRRISESTLALVESLLKENSQEKLELSRLDLVEVLDEICLQSEAQIIAKGQSLQKNGLKKPVFVLGNKIKLEELFFNIIGNAIKYSPPGTTIRVTSFSEAGKVRICVEDEGPGFSVEDRERAFRFGQTLSARPTGQESASGYGLFVAKQIVELHGGRIWIEDRPQKVGSCVSIEIPEVAI